MEAFERKLSEVFDHNRFELHPEMQELISDFEKRHLAKNRENNKREAISFKELEGQLWFSDNAFVIAEVGKGGTVSLNELDETVSASEILPMPVSKKPSAFVW